MADLLKAERLADGRERRFHRDGKDIVVSTKTDVQPLVDANKRSFNDAPERFGSGAFHKVAEIDANTIENLARSSGCSFGELIRCDTDKAAAAWTRFLNDRDNRAFRTRPGRVVMKPK